MSDGPVVWVGLNEHGCVRAASIVGEEGEAESVVFVSGTKKHPLRAVRHEGKSVKEVAAEYACFLAAGERKPGGGWFCEHERPARPVVDPNQGQLL